MDENLSSDYSFSGPWDEFRSHPGQVAYVKWNLLRDFYQNVVKVNGVSLIHIAVLPGADKKLRRKLLNAAMRDEELGYDGEVTRRLYNYITSAATLADHCRNVMKPYQNTPFYEEYEEKVDKFKSLPESIFLKDLRNYFAHHKIPSIGCGLTNFDNDKDFRSEALIYTSDLSDSDRWSAGSRRYIQDHFPNVYISDLIRQHLKHLGELYSWIFSNFMRLHEEEYNDSLKLRQQIINRH